MSSLASRSKTGVERVGTWENVVEDRSAVVVRESYLIIKRLMDLALSLIGLVALAPVMAAIAILIKIDSPGPVLFLQTRIGKKGHPFEILKFRTMTYGLDDSYHKAFMRAFVRGEINAENPTASHLSSSQDSCLQRRLQARSDPDQTETVDFKPFQDSQVTRVGRFLRKTSLDELPQMINILRGEMSWVGPRPNVPWEVEEYRDWQRARLAVLPGITGLAQVNGRSAIDFDTIAKYDIEYVQTRNLWLDVSILAQTVLSVLSGRGAH